MLTIRPRNNLDNGRLVVTQQPRDLSQDQSRDVSTIPLLMSRQHPTQHVDQLRKAQPKQLPRQPLTLDFTSHRANVLRKTAHRRPKLLPSSTRDAVAHRLMARTPCFRGWNRGFSLVGAAGFEPAATRL